MEDNYVIFTQRLPAEKQAEGLAIQHAVISGKCNSCGYLLRCSTHGNGLTT